MHQSFIMYVKVGKSVFENSNIYLFKHTYIICLGFPLTISLIGAQLETHKEETINNVDRWTFYLEELSDKSSEPFR